MKAKNNLPKYWAVQNDGSDLFKETVIKYLINVFNVGWEGSNNTHYYGYDNSIQYSGTNCKKDLKYFNNNPILLTLEQFIEMSKPIEEWIPQQGELVEVSLSNESWFKRIYLTSIKVAGRSIICVDFNNEKQFKNNEEFGITGWKYIRKIQESEIIEVTLEQIAKTMNIPINQLRIKK